MRFCDQGIHELSFHVQLDVLTNSRTAKANPSTRPAPGTTLQSYGAAFDLVEMNNPVSRKVLLLPEARSLRIVAHARIPSARFRNQSHFKHCRLFAPSDLTP